MKTRVFFAAVIICTAAFSCSREVAGTEGKDSKRSTMYLSVLHGTRAAGGPADLKSSEDRIASLDVFVFRDDRGMEDDGILDTYRRFSGSELGNLSGLEVKTTAGPKYVYVIANADLSGAGGIVSLSDFNVAVSDLRKERPGGFVMTGKKEVTLEMSSSVSISLERMVCRVSLQNIRTDFSGTPYEGMKLENVKVFLTDVRYIKKYSDGNDPYYKDGTVPSLNHCGLVPADTSAMSGRGFLCDAIPDGVSGDGTSVPHYFYCYENILGKETSDEKFTRLVIQADLNGSTYFYPVCVNRGASNNSSPVPSGVVRNTSYGFDITILRPGVSDPSESLDSGSMTVSIDVADWKVVPVTYISF